MKKILFGTLVVLTISQSIFALDIITSPIQVFTKPCSNYLRYDYASAFCYTQKLTYTYSRDKGYGAMNTVMFLVSLPFMILDEDSGNTVMDSQTLLDQGYSESEILRYKSDIELVTQKIKEVLR